MAGGVPASPEQRAWPPDPNPTGSARRAAHRARKGHLAAAAAAAAKAASAAPVPVSPDRSPYKPYPGSRGAAEDTPAQPSAPATAGGVWGAGLGMGLGGTSLGRAASPTECSPMDWTAPAPASRSACSSKTFLYAFVTLDTCFSPLSDGSMLTHTSKSAS